MSSSRRAYTASMTSDRLPCPSPVCIYDTFPVASSRWQEPVSEWVSSSRRASKRSYHFAWIISGPKKFPVTRTTSIQVLDLPAGQVGTPDVFQSLIYEETIVRLKASKCFREVLRAGEATQDNRNVLVLQLSIVAFQEGKPCIHELMGVAGKARATVEAVLRNKANEVLRDSIVNGTCR